MDLGRPPWPGGLKLWLLIIRSLSAVSSSLAWVTSERDTLFSQKFSWFLPTFSELSAWYKWNILETQIIKKGVWWNTYMYGNWLSIRERILFELITSGASIHHSFWFTSIFLAFATGAGLDFLLLFLTVFTPHFRISLAFSVQ